MAPVRVSDYILAAIRDQGVTHCFMDPGGLNDAFMEPMTDPGAFAPSSPPSRAARPTLPPAALGGFQDASDAAVDDIGALPSVTGMSGSVSARCCRTTCAGRFPTPSAGASPSTCRSRWTSRQPRPRPGGSRCRAPCRHRATSTCPPCAARPRSSPATTALARLCFSWGPGWRTRGARGRSWPSPSGTTCRWRRPSRRRAPYPRISGRQDSSAPSTSAPIRMASELNHSHRSTTTIVASAPYVLP
jgi:hypothetical protein